MFILILTADFLKFDAESAIKFFKRMKKKVVIIGAGMSGMGANVCFEKAHFDDYVIVEAQNYVGGRVRSALLDNENIELGAQWLHGEHNRLFRELESLNVLKKCENDSNESSAEACGLFVHESGFVYDRDLVEKTDFQIGQILFECEQLKNDTTYLDRRSVEEILREKFSRFLEFESDLRMRKLKTDLLDWHIRFQVIDNSCASLKDVSAKLWGCYESSSISSNYQDHLTFKHGFSDIFKHLYNEKKILLKTAVKQIDWTGEKVKVSCENNLLILADSVILTASFGFLKDHMSNFFRPSLPPDLENFITNTGFYGINKIFLLFDYEWWTCNDGFQLVFDQESFKFKKHWIRDVTGFDVIKNSKILLGWIGGAGAKIIESVSEDEIATECVHFLRAFLKNPQIPDAVQCIRTKWISNKWVKGAYSYKSLKNKSDRGYNISNICFSDHGKPSVIIAGEAMHPSHYSTTHGAFENGYEAAQILLKIFNENIGS